MTAELLLLELLDLRKVSHTEISLLIFSSALGRPISRRELDLYTRKLPIWAHVLKEPSVTVCETSFLYNINKKSAILFFVIYFTEISAFVREIPYDELALNV